MAQDSSTSILDQLKSSEQDELMTAINELRGRHVRRGLDLPQIIVCGNQSSGKSSVLASITRVAFPVGAGTKTRFASELTMRDGNHESRRAILKPAADADDKTKSYLAEFQHSFERAEDFPKVMDAATCHLEKLHGEISFSPHMLCVEIIGPDQPHLTLVDMPGLISYGAPNKEIELIQDTVRHFMKQPESIILTVMAATDDASNQLALRLAEKYDPEKRRTMGILTKPDVPKQRSPEEKLLVDMVQKSSHDPLGWHVLRNRDFALEGATAQAVDEQEELFFQDPERLWHTLTADRRGVGALRMRLSRILFETIARSLPKLTREVHVGLQSAKEDLKKLGDPRPGRTQQLVFLNGIVMKVNSLIAEGVKGDYDDQRFFADADAKTAQAKRIRTSLVHLGKQFADGMRNAQLYHVCDNEKQANGKCVTHHTPVSTKEFRLGSELAKGCVSEGAMLRAIQKHIADDCTQTLPGEYEPKVISSVFRYQASAWEALTSRYVQCCLSACTNLFTTVLGHLTTQHTVNRIMKQIAEPKLEKCRALIEDKLEELLFSFMRARAFTRNPEYEERVGAKDKQRNSSADPVNGGPRRILNRSEALYETCLYTYVDNVCSLLVERCIVGTLEHLLSTEELFNMSDEDRAFVAAEPESQLQERIALQESITVLQMVSRVCNKYCEADYEFVNDTRVEQPSNSVEDIHQSEVPQVHRPREKTDHIAPINDALRRTSLTPQKKRRLNVPEQFSSTLTPPQTPEPASRRALQNLSPSPDSYRDPICVDSDEEL
ncbi:Interferon-induced GTP-binding protein Mx [Pseudocercospora fuligena]|uniref:Interferon-induced GTP-binding protein Mx n=1 Tax=Pseudocercospora fuligena TaxID=685502 RepID=A0A8H6RAH6_9PEZI|nr:Interferon-induced GTP-binding protein Mx [Pseudocercospora fuligena]